MFTVLARSSNRTLNASWASSQRTSWLRSKMPSGFYSTCKILRLPCCPDWYAVPSEIVSDNTPWHSILCVFYLHPAPSTSPHVGPSICVLPSRGIARSERFRCALLFLDGDGRYDGTAPAARRQMTVSKTYVADTCRTHQYTILHARRKLKHRVPRPIPNNRVWGCDLLTKADEYGHRHLAIAIVDHASRPVGTYSASRTSHRGHCGRNSRRR